VVVGAPGRLKRTNPSDQGSDDDRRGPSTGDECDAYPERVNIDDAADGYRNECHHGGASDDSRAHDHGVLQA
jgi:hypothetical protein